MLNEFRLAVANNSSCPVSNVPSLPARPLLWALWATHRNQQIKTGLLIAVMEMGGLVQAVVLGWLLTSIGDPDSKVEDLYTAAAALTAVTAFRAVFNNLSALAMWRGTMELRASAIGVCVKISFSCSHCSMGSIL